jgi:enoyl-CoA hydratase/carnithine racemase
MEHLTRLVGATLTADLVLSCRPLGAGEALRSGLVSQVVPIDRFEAELETLLTKIARKPKIVLRISKQQLLAIRNGRFDPRNDADAMLSSLQDPEAMKAGLDYISRRIEKKGGAGP